MYIKPRALNPKPKIDPLGHRDVHEPVDRQERAIGLAGPEELDLGLRI